MGKICGRIVLNSPTGGEILPQFQFLGNAGIVTDGSGTRLFSQTEAAAELTVCGLQIYDAASVLLSILPQRVAQILRVSGASNRSKRVLIRMPHSFCCCHQPVQQSCMGIQSPGTQVLDVISGEGGNLGGIAVCFICVHQIEKGLSAGKGLVQAGCIFVKIFTHRCDLLCLGCILFRSGGLGDLGSIAQLVQYISLFGFIGVQFQAEISNANIGQTTLHHFQGCHFLGHEQDGFALGQSIGDEGGDGLGFTGAGRAVEDETFALGGGFDSVKLGCICAQGQQYIVLGNPVPNGHLVGFPAKLAVHQTADDLIFCQVFAAVADIIPHDELGKGKNAQVSRFQHIPTGLIHNALAQDGEYFTGVDPFLIHGQGIQTVDLDAKILLDLFQNGDIHLGIIIPQAQHITLADAFAHQFHRQQNDGGEPGFGALGSLIPAQKAQGKIQGVGTVFFQSGFGIAVQIFQRVGKFRFCIGRAQPLILEFRCNQRVVALQVMKGIQRGFLVPMQITGPGMDGKILAIGECIFQIIQGGGQNGNGGTAQPHIDQIIS